MITVRTSKKSYSFLYDFTVDGGGISSKLAPFILPGGCIVDLVTVSVITTVTSGGLATIELGTGNGANTANWFIATAIAGLTAGAVLIAVPAVPAVIAAGGEAPSLTIAAFALTAGKIKVSFDYYEY